jgi:ribonuclease E
VREQREPREAREPREPREAREPREPREPVPARRDTGSPAQAELPMTAAPERSAPPPAPPAPPPIPDLPPIALTLPPDSGLELVETSRRAPAPLAEEPQAPRPKRVRPPRVEVASEPLEIIETRKEQPPAP